MFKKLSAYKTYLLFSGATAFLFSLAFTVNMVYQVEKIHLNPLQLVLVGTTLEASCFLFEIPTGIVADIYSRKLSVIIGLILIGTGFILQGSILSFGAVLASQVLWGTGYTFLSGAIDAWIAGEDKDRDLNEIYIKGSQIGQICSIAGIVISTVLANLSTRLPIIASGLCFVALGVFFTFFMPEEHFTSSAPEDLNTFGKMLHTFKGSLDFIKSKPVIMLLLLVTLFYGLSSEGYDRLTTVHFLQDTSLPKLWNLQPVTWFGIFSIAAMIISAVGMQFINKIMEKNKKLQSIGILLPSAVFHIVSMIIFALTRDFNTMLIAYLSVSLFRTAVNPVFKALMNSHLEDKARATVLSTNGQIDALGQILGGPAIGVIATKLSIGIGIASTALLLSPVVLLYVIILFKTKQYNSV